MDQSKIPKLAELWDARASIVELILVSFEYTLQSSSQIRALSQTKKIPLKLPLQTLAAMTYIFLHNVHTTHTKKCILSSVVAPWNCFRTDPLHPERNTKCTTLLFRTPFGRHYSLGKSFGMAQSFLICLDTTIVLSFSFLWLHFGRRKFAKVSILLVVSHKALAAILRQQRHRIYPPWALSRVEVHFLTNENKPLFDKYDLQLIQLWMRTHAA